MGKYTDNFNQKISALNPKNYQRDGARTFTSGPEWRNVEMAEEFATFLQDKPFYRFPFFRQIFLFWKVFFLSYRAAHKNHSFFSLLFADHMIMNLFIGIASSIEFATLGMISLFLWPFLKKENPSPFQERLSAIFNNYAQFIHHTPFYNYPYFKMLKKLCIDYWHSEGKTFADFVSLLVLGLNFLFHGIIAAPIGLFYNQEAVKEAETIEVILKKRVEEDIPEETVAKHFKQQLAQIEEVSIVEANGQSRVFTRQSDNPNKHCTYVYAHVRLPRYEQFKDTVMTLATAGINTRKIAGHDYIQMKCLVEGETAEKLAEQETAIQTIPGCKKLYTYRNGLEINQTFFALQVETRHLDKTIQQIAEIQGSHIKIMHDF